VLQGDQPERDLTGFVLPELGELRATENPWRPYELLDRDGAVVEPVRVFFAELQAETKPAATVRSYGMDLLRWWQFLWACGIEWNRADRRDARDFIRWMQVEQAAALALETPPGRVRHRDGAGAKGDAEEYPRIAERHNGKEITWVAVRRVDARTL
jgi:hypothetical protein